MIGNLSGIPIRLYSGGELRFFHALTRFPKDPISVHLNEVMEIHSSVGYFVTEEFCYYGVLNSDDVKIVIGPTSQTAIGDRELRELAFRADVPPQDTENFLDAMKSIIHMPLESILQMLCVVGYYLNGEKLQLSDIAIFESEQTDLHDLLERQYADEAFSVAAEAPLNYEHNTYSVEQEIMDLIQRGDADRLREWASTAPAIRGGVLASDQLRQLKNTFIVIATLASRAAIRGGMDVEEALTLSDAFIQRCELLGEPDRIMNLQFHMVLEFAQRVSALRIGGQSSKLVIDVINYIRHHLTEPITVEAIAQHLYISRPHLSAKFRAETGETLTDFILKEKTEEAKRLLRYTDKTATAIAAYLGFSSQSHFTRVFKKYAEITPKEYRERYT